MGMKNKIDNLHAIVLMVVLAVIAGALGASIAIFTP
jgi:hypothetical protein